MKLSLIAFFISCLTLVLSGVADCLVGIQYSIAYILLSLWFMLIALFLHLRGD